jgi:hypothetical protein
VPGQAAVFQRLLAANEAPKQLVHEPARRQHRRLGGRGKATVAAALAAHAVLARRAVAFGVPLGHPDRQHGELASTMFTLLHLKVETDQDWEGVRDAVGRIGRFLEELAALARSSGVDERLLLGRLQRHPEADLRAQPPPVPHAQLLEAYYARAAATGTAVAL